MILSLLSLFLCVDLAVSKATLSLHSDSAIRSLIQKKRQLFFQIPAGANVPEGPYPDAPDYSITVVSGGMPTMTYSNGKIVINAKAAAVCAASSAPSSFCSPLALWTGAGAASILSGNRDVNRIVLGTTAIIATSSLMNMAQAQCQFDIYFNLPSPYVQDSVPTDAQNGIKFVSFINLEKRAKSTLKVNGGTCSLGQCGGPSSAGPEGCQCDDRCTELGDCCGDYGP